MTESDYQRERGVGGGGAGQGGNKWWWKETWRPLFSCINSFTAVVFARVWGSHRILHCRGLKSAKRSWLAPTLFKWLSSLTELIALPNEYHIHDSTNVLRFTYNPINTHGTFMVISQSSRNTCVAQPVFPTEVRESDPFTQLWQYETKKFRGLIILCPGVVLFPQRDFLAALSPTRHHTGY